MIEERGKLKQGHERICITGNEAKGWSVIIVWECQLKKAVLEDTVNRVAAEIRHNGEILRCAQNDRRKAREKYLMERKNRKEREQALLKEVKSL